MDAESVEVTLNKKKKKGYLLCGKCEKTFETPINRKFPHNARCERSRLTFFVGLSHAVDVYEAWHDFLEAEMEKKIAAIDPPIVKPPKKRRYSPY